MRRGVGPVAEVRKYLEDVEFPAEKQDILDYLDFNRVPVEVRAVVDQLPSKTYMDLDDVMDEVPH